MTLYFFLIASPLKFTPCVQRILTCSQGSHFLELPSQPWRTTLLLDTAKPALIFL
jgi:hypothetical protein